jgi:hypothetical protein
MLRQARADGTIVLSVRRDETSPWIELFRARSDNPFELAQIEQKQKIYLSHEIVREVFFDMVESHHPDELSSSS